MEGRTRRTIASLFSFLLFFRHMDPHTGDLVFLGERDGLVGGQLFRGPRPSFSPPFFPFFFVASRPLCYCRARAALPCSGQLGEAISMDERQSTEAVRPSVVPLFPFFFSFFFLSFFIAEFWFVPCNTTGSRSRWMVEVGRSAVEVRWSFFLIFSFLSFFFFFFFFLFLFLGEKQWRALGLLFSSLSWGSC